MKHYLLISCQGDKTLYSFDPENKICRMLAEGNENEVDKMNSWDDVPGGFKNVDDTSWGEGCTPNSSFVDESGTFASGWFYDQTYDAICDEVKSGVERGAFEVLDYRQVNE